MDVFLVALTYFAYIFIVFMYIFKSVKLSRLPAHLRWELYPRKGTLYLIKENFRFSDYFKTNWTYWLALFPWHIGFIFIITFHILCFFGAVVMLAGNPVAADSAYVIGRVFYYGIMVIGAISFITGILGSIGLIIKRMTDNDLKTFATRYNYFNYVFTLVVFFSGLYAWIFVDPSLAQYREFWKGLVTLNPASVEPATAVHIILFCLFLIYLPFTRSMHYITKFFAFLWIRWDSRPNLRGSVMEREINKMLRKPVSWSAPHIPSGKTWSELVAKKHDDEKTP